MIHSFDSNVAMVVGVKGAILLHHIGWWVEKNKANETNYRDGHYWTYNSAKAYTVMFPFWSLKVIQRELRKLEFDGYIKSGCYNNTPTDRTKWYTLTDKAYALINNEKDKMETSNGQKCPMEGTEMSNGMDENVQSSYNSNKTYSNKHSNKGEEDKTCTPELAEALNAFLEHRKKLKKPMTDYAKKLLLDKLQKLAKTEQEQIAILNQSIENGWQGVFPLGGDKGRKSWRDKSVKEQADQLLQEMEQEGYFDDNGGAKGNDADIDGLSAWLPE